MRCEVVMASRVWCDGCREPIEAPADGAIVRGAVYTAEVRRAESEGAHFEPVGGLIGDASGVGLYAYHWVCLLRAVGWGVSAHPRVDAVTADAIFDALYPSESDGAEGDAE